jgi:hypothetical protein
MVSSIIDFTKNGKICLNKWVGKIEKQVPTLGKKSSAAISINAMPRLLHCFCPRFLALRPSETPSSLFVSKYGVKLVSKETA